MKIQIFDIKSCCAGSATLLKADKPFLKDMVKKFEDLGFVASETFLKSGILHLNNEELFLMGSFGSNSLQIKCKKKSCKEFLPALEDLFKNF